MKEQVIETITKYAMISQGETIVLAVSGGIDSMCLLHLFDDLKKVFGLTLVVAHLDHAKRTDSELDARLVLEYCNSNDYIFEKETLPEQEKAGNFQSYARDFRYDFFKRIASRYNGSKIVTAHHADDHLETVVASLMKSEKPSSLVGIKPIGIVNGIEVIRPLIEVTKAQILLYASKYCVNYNEDSSNLTDFYFRNRIRHHITPLMVKERFDVTAHARNLSDNLLLDEEYFEQQLMEILSNIKIIDNGYEFSNSWFKTLHPSLKRRLVTKLIPSISRGAIQGMNRFLSNNSPSGECCVGFGTVVKKSYDKVLMVDASFDEKTREFEFELPVNSVIELPDGKKIKLFIGNDKNFEKSKTQSTFLCYNSICMPLSVRSRRAGDKIQLVNGNGSASVKKIMIDAKVPIDERATWPIVVDAKDKLVWIPMLKKSPMCIDKPNSDKDLWLQIF